MIQISDVVIKDVPFKRVTVVTDSVVGCQIFKEAVTPLLNRKDNLIVDLNNILGTSVVNVLHGVYKKVNEYNGKIFIVAEDLEIRELLRLLHVDSFIPIYHTEKEINF